MTAKTYAALPFLSTTATPKQTSPNRTVPNCT